MDTVTPKRESRFKKLKGSGKKAFWIWVGYQAIKGTLTTSLIWIPLLWAYFHHG